MGFSELTLAVQDDGAIRVKRDDGAETKGELLLDNLQRSLISLFGDWLGQEKQSGQDRKMTRRYEFEIFGSLLYRTLFNGQVGSFFERSLNEIQGNKRLRIQLSFEGKAAELASIPWEYLYYPDTAFRAGFFMATSVDLVLSRYIALETAIQNLAPAESPLRILVVLSKPQDLDPVMTDEVVEAIQKLTEAFPVQVDILNRPTIENLLDKIEEVKPHVLHFIGHGRYNKEDEKGEIALLDINGRSARWVRDDEFVDYFRQMRSIPRLAFLHLCEGGAIDFTANFAGLAPRLIRVGIQAVVAMQYPITNNAAIIFSRAFYRALANGEPVDTAVQDARWRVTLTIPKAYDSRVFGIPVLYMRSRDGVIQPIIN